MIGKLKDRIEIQRATLTPDGAGGFAEAWVSIKTVYADVKRATGSRAIQYSQIREGNSYEILIREPEDFALLPGDRIVYGSKNLAFHVLTENRISEYSDVIAFEIS